MQIMQNNCIEQRSTKQQIYAIIEQKIANRVLSYACMTNKEEMHFP